MYRSRRKRLARGANGPRIRRSGSTANRIGSSGVIEKYRRSPDSVHGRFVGERSRFAAGAAAMYGSRRKRGASGANGPRIRRPGSMVSRLGFAGNIETSRRSPASVSGRILGARARLSGGASGMRESRRKRGASGANGPRIRRRGPTAIRVVCAPRLRRFRWP